jgi:DNA mismatch endonuclease (patch repair protein)
MPDVFTPEKRSAVMARIRGSGNRDTELRMIALFREHGIAGWRRGQKLFGKPDFVFRRERVAVFVDGCFWHRHPGCRFAYTPKSRLDFWLPKFERNVARDRLVTRTLRKQGWRVLRVWECDLAQKHWLRVARRVEQALGRGREGRAGAAAIWKAES